MREALQVACKVQFRQEFAIEKKVFDFYFPTLQLLIEIDSKAHHSSPRQKKNDWFKDKLAKEKGLKLVRVRVSSDMERQVLKAVRERTDELYPDKLPPLPKQPEPARHKRPDERPSERFIRRWQMHHQEVFRTPSKISTDDVTAIEDFFKIYPHANINKLFKIARLAWRRSEKTNQAPNPKYAACHASCNVTSFVTNITGILGELDVRDRHSILGYRIITPQPVAAPIPPYPPVPVDPTRLKPSMRNPGPRSAIANIPPALHPTERSGESTEAWSTEKLNSMLESLLPPPIERCQNAQPTESDKKVEPSPENESEARSSIPMQDFSSESERLTDLNTETPDEKVPAQGPLAPLAVGTAFDRETGLASMFSKLNAFSQVRRP